MSNQASYEGQFKSMRISEDHVPTNYMQGQWDMYAQEQPAEIEQVQYANLQSEGEGNTSLDFQYTNSKTETEEDQYDGMNFEEYCKNATSPAEVSQNNDSKLAISDEQRENLMKRIMLLKMQQNNSQSQGNDENHVEVSHSQNEGSEMQDQSDNEENE